ncbi:ABC-2 type transport system ATP-binding protein [Kandleria vitulina]|nr:ABC transporter ATP-binding protein [Kandleria vitulina]SEJ28771.1 ABC-2 type transport system ATP-binding protein [Kandleria vitulina]
MENILEVNNINKSFGTHTVLEDVSFKINPGEIIGLVGRNGSGKTTLMKCILGLISIDAGEILFNDSSEYYKNKDLMDQIGYLLDCKLFENLNAYENIKIQEWYKGKRYKKEKEKAIIEDILNLVDLKNDNKKVKAYSFGMKQRLGLALALLGNTRLLILDEPFVGLDPVGIQIIRNFIIKMSKERNMAILISSHQLSEIEGICERYLFISDRRIKAYAYDERRKVIIYTKTQIPEEIKSIIQEKNVTNRVISFWFEEKVFNDVIKCLVTHNVIIKDIKLSKMSLDKLFKEE